MPKPRNATSEPAEHVFGCFRTKNREFTTLGFAQLSENQERRDKVMYAGNLRPSRDPGKGYRSSYQGYVEQSKVSSQELKAGPVAISDDGDAIVKQIWAKVDEVIAYSANIVQPFLVSMGVSEAEMSPFCRQFKDPKDLRDTFIKICPRTFQYEGTIGEGDDDAAIEEEEGAEDQGQEMALRIKHFAQELLGELENNRAEVVVIDEAPSDDAPPMNEDSPNGADSGTESANTAPTADANKLMESFKNMLKINSASDVGDAALAILADVESKDKHVGSISSERKAKSLQNRWISKPLRTSSNKDKKDDAAEGLDVWVERDTVISADVSIGRGAAATTVRRQYRVLGLYTKFYNKWFMTGDRQRWAPTMKEEEKKKYKMAVRMVEPTITGEYEDVDLNDETYKHKNVCKIMDGTMIKSVVGKLGTLIDQELN